MEGAEKNGGNQCCLADRAGPRGFSLMPEPPGRTQRALGSAWVRRITFGPNPTKNETLGGRLGGKSPAGVEKVVLKK